MRILLTGGTGFIGSAVREVLLSRGHSVTVLVRSTHSASALAGEGIPVHQGDVEDPLSVLPALETVDAVVHTAFNHDFSQYSLNAEGDATLLMSMAAALRGSGKTIVATSATTVVLPGKIASEADPPHPANPRSASEAILFRPVDGVRVSVVRLPPSVHGRGDRAFVPALIDIARRTGKSAFVGQGDNRWAAVHRLDAARLFCDAVEQGRSGARYHGVAEDSIPFRTIAEAIASGLRIPAVGITPDEAEEHFGWLSMFAGADIPAASEHTRKVTGWQPREPDLITDMQDAGYFGD